MAHREDGAIDWTSCPPRVRPDADEEQFAELIVHEHPQYQEPITLDVPPEEIGELPESEQYVSIEVIGPGSAAGSGRCCHWIGSTS
jgi:hypothetical protein